MSGYLATEILSGKTETPLEVAPGSVIRGSEYVNNLISGSPFLEPARPELAPAQENFGVVRGIAWSLVFEGTAAAACFALWQVWKLLR